MKSPYHVWKQERKLRESILKRRLIVVTRLAPLNQLSSQPSALPEPEWTASFFNLLLLHLGTYLIFLLTLVVFSWLKRSLKITWPVKNFICQKRSFTRFSLHTANIFEVIFLCPDFHCNLAVRFTFHCCSKYSLIIVKLITVFLL